MSVGHTIRHTGGQEADCHGGESQCLRTGQVKLGPELGNKEMTIEYASLKSGQSCCHIEGWVNFKIDEESDDITGQFYSFLYSLSLWCTMYFNQWKSSISTQTRSAQRQSYAEFVAFIIPRFC